MGAVKPLFTDVPRRGLLGNLYAVPCIGPARWAHQAACPQSQRRPFDHTTSWSGGWICAVLHPTHRIQSAHKERAGPPRTPGGSQLQATLALSKLTRERNRERGYMFVPCIGLRPVFWYRLRWIDETATDGDPGRLGAVLGAEL